MTLHVALTGGIGSGKSTAAKLFVDLGATLIDADVLAREVVEPGTPALAQIEAEFGPRVIATDGSLDRAALAELVFADEEALATLNGIVHPAVRHAGAARREAALAADPTAIIIEDIPLLAETGQGARFHGVILVHTPTSLRLPRLEARGMSETEARARMAAQATDAERFAIADVIIHNDDSLTHLQAQVEQIWRDWLRPYRDALAGLAPPRPVVGQADDGARRRALDRIRAALTEVELAEGPDGTVEVSADLPGEAITAGLAAAGFVPAAAGTYVSANPAAPLRLHLG